MFPGTRHRLGAVLSPVEEKGERLLQVKEGCADGIAVICLAKDNIEDVFINIIIKCAAERCVYVSFAISRFLVFRFSFCWLFDADLSSDLQLFFRKAKYLRS
jgi:hypothetical protein